MTTGIRTTRPAAAALLLALLALLPACSDEGPGPVRSATSTAAPTTAPTTSADTAASEPAHRSTGCGTDPDVARFTGEVDGDAPASFVSDGLERTYRLTVPATYDPDHAAPLVLQLHGRTATALKIDRYTGLAKAAAERGMLVITPDAIDTLWDVEPVGRDGTFLDALLDDVMARYCVDEDSVFAVGMSLGAWRTAGSACAAPGRFAAIALVALELAPTDCGPIPVVAIHGTADEEIPYGAGGGTIDPATGAIPNLPGTLENMARWATHGGCATDSTSEPIGDDVVRHRYPGCTVGVDVELYTVVGGGHSWPSPAVDLAPDTPTTRTIDATEIALDFFDDHRP